MRFKLDECIPEEAVEVFRVRGHDAETVRGQGRAGINDAQLLELCGGERYVLVTADRGFGNIVEHPPRETSGIVLMRLRPYNFASAMASAAALLNYIDAQEAGVSLQGRLVIVDPDRAIRFY
jgi:predicted nuclease of predicted toxin-antitoxin system